MTEQDVFDMAREVCGKWPRVMTSPNLQAFAKLVATKEREACAKIAETPISGEQDDITMQAKDRVAKAIRARGEA